MNLLFDPMIYFNKDENEVWKPLVFDKVEIGRYMISNHGNVYDMRKGVYVTPTLHNHGYLAIQLSGNYLLLHRVMAENFVAEKRVDQIYVNHKDGVKTNPSETNLEWCTMEENNRHATETGLMKSGEDVYNARITNEIAETICQLLSESKSYTEILDAIGFEHTNNNRALIENIRRRIAWNHISYKYEFPSINRSARFINDEIAEDICKAIVQGLNDKEICESVFGIKVDKWTKDTRSHQLAINNIRRKINYKHISSKYF